jgi:hypothetical protein
MVKSLIKSAIKSKKKRKPRPAAAGGGKRPPGNGKKGTTGGALFNQQGVSKRGKSRKGEDSDVLAGDSPTRRRAEKLEKRSMVSEPNYPKMDEVGTGGEKVVQGGGTSVMQAARSRRLINEKSTQQAIKAQERINKRLDELKAKLKDATADKNISPGRRVMNAQKIKKEIDVQKDLLQQAKDKQKSASGKSKKSPRVPVADYNKGGSVRKTLKSVPQDNVGLSKLSTPVRNKMGYMKKGGKVSKPLGCGTAQRGFGRGPYKKRGM